MNITALKCKNCGAPMAPDVKNSEFLCGFCRSTVPFATDNYQVPILFRHQPVRVVDGYLKLGHVYVEEKIDYRHQSGDNFVFYNTRMSANQHNGRENQPKLHRWSSTEEKIKAYDPETFETMINRADFSFNCKSCGGRITGYTTQTTFKCPNCSTLIADADVMESGEYPKSRIIGEDVVIADWLLPFSVKRERAKSLIKEMAKENPEHFEHIKIEGLLTEQSLSATLIPHELADLRLRTKVETERGTHWFYNEWFNWAIPKNHFYDSILLDDLQPWDFGRMEAYNPAYLEGDIRIVGLCNGWERIPAVEHILLEKLPREIKETYSLQKATPTHWSKDLRMHHFAYIALPVYHTEKIDAQGEVQVRITVNGQTGKVVAAIRKNNSVHYCYLDTFRQEMTPECSMHSMPTPVRYAGSPLLYEITDISTRKERKEKSLFSRLFH